MAKRNEGNPTSASGTSWPSKCVRERGPSGPREEDFSCQTVTNPFSGERARASTLCEVGHTAARASNGPLQETSAQVDYYSEWYVLLLQQLALLRTLVPLLICQAADTGDNFSMLSALLAADCVL